MWLIKNGGETGIRTQERVAPLPVFKTGAFNRSAISPCARFYKYNPKYQLKKKIIYRSNYRGTKEMDKLLGKFVKKYINELEEDDLIDLDKLLNIDDTNLYNFYNGFDTEFEIEKNNISLLFKNFKY